MRNTNTFFAFVAAVLIALAPSGCSDDTSGPGVPGGAEVKVYAISDADVATVTVTVTGPGIAEPIVVNLTLVGDQWVANLSAIPAGIDRIFALSAKDINGVEIYSGVATGVTISSGQTAAVSISGQETAPAVPIGNQSPVIDAMTAAATVVAPGGSIALAVVAHDGDVGDFITYQWTTTGGTLETPAQASATWSAPNVEGTYRVTVQVQDTHGASASMYLDLTVGGEGNAEATISVSLNKWPVVTGVSSTKGRINVNESTTLDVVATDADNDALTYAWIVDAGCAGSFALADVKSPTFTLGGTLPEAGTCQFTVTVADGRGGTNTGSLTISAAAAPAVNLAPRITSATQSVQSVSSSQTVTMMVNAEDPEASAITFTWTATGGTLGTPTTTSGSSQMVWTAPNPFGSTVYVRCTVADASGLLTVKMFTIYVATSTSTSTSTNTSTSVDVTPPTVSALSLSTSTETTTSTSLTVDTSAGSVTVAVAFTVADELSGIASVSFRFDSPSGSQNQQCEAIAPTDAADPLTMTGSCNLNFLQNSEAGLWQVNWMKILDKAGNTRQLDAAALTTQGLPSSLTVQAPTVDTAAPAVTALSFAPTSIDTTNGEATVTVTATITDNLSGFANAGFLFYEPGGTTVHTCWIRQPSGSSQLRVYSSSCTVTFPQYSAPGTWVLNQVYLDDEATNVIRLTAADLQALGLPVNLTVTSTVVDTTAPTLVAFSFTPSVDTAAAAATVTVNVSVTDSQSGIWEAGVKFTSPSGAQSQECFVAAPGYAPAAEVTGTCTVVIPRYSEVGQWTVEYLYALDQVFNFVLLEAADLTALGLQSTLTVTSGL